MADEFKSTAPKPFVFVLMPFAPEFDDIYNFGIKGAADDAGAYAERIDEQLFAENILARMYNQINKADVLVADMTGRNANVFYEVGYAHALGKVVLLLTKNADDIPFDLKHYPHIVYGGSISHLRNDLSKRLAWAIAESKRIIRDIGEYNFEVSIGKIDIPKSLLGIEIPMINIEGNDVINFYTETNTNTYSEYINSFAINFTIINSGNRKSNEINNVYIFLDEICDFYPHESTKSYSKSENKYQYHMIRETIDSLPPSALKVITIIFYRDTRGRSGREKEQITLRVHVSDMFYDYPFFLVSEKF